MWQRLPENKNKLIVFNSPHVAHQRQRRGCTEVRPEQALFVGGTDRVSRGPGEDGAVLGGDGLPIHVLRVQVSALYLGNFMSKKFFRKL